MPADPRSEGVVVVEMGEGSALEKAGLLAGDVLISWERLASPPANPHPAQGKLASPFDWTWLAMEQGPRGRVKVRGRRQDEAKEFVIAPGRWQGDVRPRMTGEILEDYTTGKDLIEAAETEAGIDLWQGVAVDPSVEGRSRCWLLLNIGKAWGRARQWEKAHGAFRSALEAAPDPLARAAVWQAIGDTYKKVSELEMAREAYGSAQEIRQKTWHHGLVFARGLTDLGILDAMQGRLDSAETYLQRALQIQQELAPGSLAVAASLNNLGIMASRRGALDRAASYHEESLEIRQELAPGSLDVAGSLNNLGSLAWDRGDLEYAAEYFERSLVIKQKLAPGSLDVAGSLHNLAMVARERGALSRAARYQQRALEIQQESAPGSLEVANSLNNLGILARRRGDLDRAAAYYEESLEIGRRLATGSLWVAGILNNLGTLALKRGDLDRAAEYYGESLEIQRASAPESLDVARSLNSLGVLATERGTLDQAAGYLEEALEIQRKLAPDSLDVAATLNNLGELAHHRSALKRAAGYFEKALEIGLRLAPESFEVAFYWHNLGLLAADRGALERAAEYHNRAVAIRQEVAPRSVELATSLHALASLRRRQDQPQQALAFFLQALQALESQVTRLGGSRDDQAGFRAERVDYYRDTVDLLLELRQPEEAFHVLERSRARSFLAQLAERDLVFSDVPDEIDRRRRSVALRYDRTQEKLAELSVSKDTEKVLALRAELRRLQGERDDIKAHLRRDYPNLAALQSPRPLDLEAARRSLDPGTVMLSYSVGAKSTDLFVVALQGELDVHSLPIGREKLDYEVRLFQKYLPGARPGNRQMSSLLAVGRRLYSTLIEPAAGRLNPARRLLIVPDGPLHVLPFGALIRDGRRDWQYLIEWKPLHSVLSATVYAELEKSRRSGESGDGASKVLLAAFGDPLYPGNVGDGDDGEVDVHVRAAVQRGFDFRRLFYSRREIEGIAGLYPPGTVRIYLGENATEERAKSLGRGLRILHIAAHSRVDDRRPLDSFVALTIPKEDSGERENGLLQAWEIFERVRLDADLVVLSACETALGKELGHEGLIGLTRAFQYAGARTVAATLWNVADQTTAELMIRFHRHLRAGRAKDVALQAAQLELIRNPIKVRDETGRTVETDASAPYFWAAFQLIGDWQ